LSAAPTPPAGHLADEFSPFTAREGRESDSEVHHVVAEDCPFAVGGREPDLHPMPCRGGDIAVLAVKSYVVFMGAAGSHEETVAGIIEACRKFDQQRG